MISSMGFTQALQNLPFKPPNNNKKNHFHCRIQSKTNLDFILHDSLDASGIDTKHARVAREGFERQIGGLSSAVERETSISINRGVDLGRAALQIAAEDDSLVSHSSVTLPVDAFIERLDDLSTGFLSSPYAPSRGSSPEIFLESLERFLYVHKGFQRITTMNGSNTRALYLHSVLTCRSGSVAMLSLIYSEILKMLRLWGLLNFDAEIYFPHDSISLPRGYVKQKSKQSDQQHIMTAQTHLVEFYWQDQAHCETFMLHPTTRADLEESQGCFLAIPI
ncbi:hypothetical protein QJS10_CPB17g01806 [Acorus calamus]|uniref:Protein SirB1 N-terminal domain-containing protein n=1 Tax=Acorus calamus TaxID=4465 RepID=A0AAV9CQM7_ACOCL|nr:hypothetical protein QJS10_CPB17g01806 [Acorus calamus]